MKRKYNNLPIPKWAYNALRKIFGTERFPLPEQSWKGIALPNVRRVFAEMSAEEFVSVDPMTRPSSFTFYMEIMDENNPVIGQIFSLEEKEPHDHGDQPCMCCMRGPCWHKIWTPDGWVFEKGNEDAYNVAVEKYNIPYREAEKARHEKECAEYNARLKQETPPTDDWLNWKD